MKKIIFTIILFAAIVNAQSMKQNGFRSLFSDYKAVNLGDAITIVVLESSQAANSAQKNAGRKSDIGFGASGGLDDTKLPAVSLDLDSKNQFKGSGSSKTSGMVRTKLSALIDSVLSNDLVRVKGSRKIVVNDEEQMITIKGLVRTSDISSNNTVFSYNISDAEIIFQSDGQIKSMQEPGWITKLFHWLF
ncbi:MAG: flagellar basal body L-ring protein [Ignavibacteriae bacterium]|nr:MAG: flagellar basal body L-ring protein [Ignavibacteriota bacterium]